MTLESNERYWVNEAVRRGERIRELESALHDMLKQRDDAEKCIAAMEAENEKCHQQWLGEVRIVHDKEQRITKLEEERDASRRAAAEYRKTLTDIANLYGECKCGAVDCQSCMAREGLA